MKLFLICKVYVVEKKTQAVLTSWHSVLWNTKRLARRLVFKYYQVTNQVLLIFRLMQFLHAHNSIRPACIPHMEDA